MAPLHPYFVSVIQITHSAISGGNTFFVIIVKKIGVVEVNIPDELFLQNPYMKKPFLINGSKITICSFQPKLVKR